MQGAFRHPPYVTRGAEVPCQPTEAEFTLRAAGQRNFPLCPGEKAF